LGPVQAYYAAGVLQRRFHSENASNVFFLHCDVGEIKKKETIATISHFGLVFEKSSGRLEIPKCFCHYENRKLLFSNPSTLKSVLSVMKHVFVTVWRGR